MNALRWVAGLLALVLLGPAVLAQSEAEVNAKYADWQWFQTVQGLDRAMEGRFSLTLPPSVLGKATRDLHDLRLVDAAGTEIPYAMRILRTEARRQPVPLARRFNEGTDEKQNYAEVSLELEPGREVTHNQLAIETSGNNYRRRVEVFGANNDKFKDKIRIVESHVLAFEVDNPGANKVGAPGKFVIGNHTFTYLPSEYRFLMVRLYADKPTEERPPTIGNVIVVQTIRQKGEYPETPVPLSQPDPVKGDNGEPGTAWIIEVNTDPVPIERLLLDTSDKDFERSYRLEQLEEMEGPAINRQVIASGTLKRWGPAVDRLTIDLPKDTRARRMRLVVTDYRNPPLTLTSAIASAPAHRLIFDVAAGKPIQTPLRLFYGNEQAGIPNYDYARKLPAEVAGQKDMLALEERQKNPAYQPPPPTLAERAPWLIYVALGGASLVLLLLLGLLGREALRREDAHPSTAKT